jgi:hypothetical protein
MNQTWNHYLQSCLENHRVHRAHREFSVLSAYSVVDYSCLYSVIQKIRITAAFLNVNALRSELPYTVWQIKLVIGTPL